MNRFLILAAVLLAVPAFAADPQTPPRTDHSKVTVADFSWLAGAWKGEIGGDFIDEQWAPPAGGAMLGTFRWLKGEKVVVYELLALEQRPEGPVLMLRHFKPGLVAWEDKEGAIPFYLTSYKPGEGVFDNRSPDTPIRIIYRKDGEALVSVLERVKDGKPASDVFRYTRR